MIKNQFEIIQNQINKNLYYSNNIWNGNKLKFSIKK